MISYSWKIFLLLLSVHVLSTSAFISPNVVGPWLTVESVHSFRDRRCCHQVPSGQLVVNAKSVLYSKKIQREAVDTTSSSSNSVTLAVPYALAWIAFVSYAFFGSPGGGIGGLESQDLLAQFLQNPLHPDVNDIFVYIFGLFAWIPFSLAALIMPGARRQKLPATPFLLGSSMIGYFLLGPYMTLRKPALDVTESELGWFTANILENKVVAWFMVLLSLSSIFSSGLFSGLLNDYTGEVQGFIHLFSTTAFASVSSVDISLLAITAASLIPEDLKSRGVKDENMARIIAISTLVLPVTGSVIYCALRPSLPKNDYN